MNLYEIKHPKWSSLTSRLSGIFNVIEPGESSILNFTWTASRQCQLTGVSIDTDKLPVNIKIGEEFQEKLPVFLEKGGVYS